MLAVSVHRLDISCTDLHPFFFAGQDICVIILLDGGQPALTLPLTSIPYSGLQVRDFVMLQQAAELEELQLQPVCSGSLPSEDHHLHAPCLQ